MMCTFYFQLLSGIGISIFSYIIMTLMQVSQRGRPSHGVVSPFFNRLFSMNSL